MSYTYCPISPFAIFTPPNPAEPYYYIVNINALTYPSRFYTSTGYYPLMRHPRVIRQRSFPNIITRKSSPPQAEQNERVIELFQTKLSCFPCDGWPVGYSKLNNPRPSPWPLAPPPIPKNNKRRNNRIKCYMPPTKRSKSTGTSL